ncbi:sulfatase [Pelagicoccus mobilis]|uniref:Sulfatase n=1 Tax=Pelagicoccus mobilis TaxID=415221 RepID=A0A934RZ01_9BACT|nr:sulfatase [Pelagicoccus mobilis]MBK1879332.1 sulfatase [Pelagicoccus mobilis]
MKPTLLLGLATLCLGLNTATAAEKRPNVLLLLVDDLKPAIGAYGDKVAVTPHIDKLASRGTLFELAYCNQAVCAPSRNNLMLGARSTSTGLYTLGLNFRKAYPDAVTMPQFFAKHGYSTAAVGKVYHVGHGNTDDTASWTEDYHFEPVVEYLLEESTKGQLTREEAYFTNAKTGKPNRELPRGAAWEKADVADNAYSDGRIADVGIERLKDYAQDDQPFFLALGFTKPHMPFTAPAKYWELYDKEKLELAAYRERPKGAPTYAHKGYGELAQYTPVPEFDKAPLAPSLQKSLIHGYYASTSYMDAQIGRVLTALDELELTDNTIVVLWSDHGFHLGDHGSWTKHSNYEQANRIPLIFSAPGVTPPGSQTKALAETVDVYPTLAALANLPPPAATVPQPFDGHSLADTLKDPSKPSKPYAYHAYPRGPQDKRMIGRALRTERYRLVEWKEPGAPESTADYELYDYRDDPLETKNIATERPDIIAEIKVHLRSLPEAKAQRPKQR